MTLLLGLMIGDDDALITNENDDDATLSNISKPHVEEEEMKETLYLGNIIMSPRKLSLVNDVTKDNLILHRHFSEENMTMFPPPKHTPFFDSYYKDIQDKNVYLCWTHCKYKPLLSILFSFIDENKHLQWEHCKYKILTLT